MIKLKSAKGAVWSDAERKAWRMPEDLTVSEWADRYRILDAKTCPEPGPWRTDRTPYLRGPMDAFCNDAVEKITMCFATQCGKSEALFNMLAYAIDQDPGPTLFVYPVEKVAKRVSYNRVIPMIRMSPRLAEQVPALGDDLTKVEYNLKNMIITFAWSNSPASLSERASRYLFRDEVNKYPAFSGREADPLALSGERTKNFWNRKIIDASTPTTEDGYITQELNKSLCFKYHVPCPHCGEYQLLLFPQVKFKEKDRDPEKIKTGRLAWYECAACGRRIPDHAKGRMLMRGVWCPEGLKIAATGKIKGKLPRSSHWGFHLPSLYSPWVSWSDVAAEFLKSKGTINLLMNFVNSWLAEPWQQKLESRTSDELGRLEGDYMVGTIPEDVIVLTAGADVHGDMKDCYYTIRGYTPGAARSYLIRAGRVPDLPDLDGPFFKTPYAKKSGEVLPVRLGCVDSGYRTAEVYKFCRTRRAQLRPIKGKDHLSGLPYRASRIDRYPGENKPIPGGLVLYHLDTSFYKDKIATSMSNSLEGEIEWYLHADVTEEYKDQICGEHKIIKLNKRTGGSEHVWVPVTAGAATHFLDCEVYAAAAADMLGVWMMTGTRKVAPAKTAGTLKDAGGEKPGWLIGR